MVLKYKILYKNNVFILCILKINVDRLINICMIFFFFYVCENILLGSVVGKYFYVFMGLYKIGFVIYIL